MPDVSDHCGELDFPSAPRDGGFGAQGGLPLFWRSAPTGSPPDGAPGGAIPLYLHGVPSSSDEWPAFLQRSGGLAPDLPGFGRSGKPGTLRYTIDEYDRFIERFLDERGVERVSLVMHDWGTVGLAFAQRLPERVARLVIINAVPFLPGYRWHRTARIWRTVGLGELAMGSTNRFILRRATENANVTPGAMPDAWLDSVLEHFEQGTQRAILRLYRSASPQVLAAAGERLGSLRIPALIAWGTRDPYIPARFARAYADALPEAELLELPDAGHWPWFDRPDLIEHVVSFLSGP